MKRLSLEDWKNVFGNIQELEEDEIEEFGEWVEIIWIETDDEWVLCYGYEVFEDGFKSEFEARKRLEDIERLVLQ